MTAPPIRIGISACLLGRPVRYDGGHKRNDFLVDTFGPHVEWVPFCPEVEVGMGTPRPTIRLVKPKGGELRLLERDSDRDWTVPMREFSKRRVAAMKDDHLCGFVLKKDSPSCGMERVKVYDAHGTPDRRGVGLFAEAVLERFPTLPVEEEGRLSDPRLRENFVERVFAYRRLRTLFTGRWSLGALVSFHAAHKLLLLAHGAAPYAELGRLVARAKELERGELKTGYESRFMAALGKPATVRLHTNVLQHMAGFFKKGLDADSRREVVEAIEDYRVGRVPRVVPLTLLRHHARVLNAGYLLGQVYLAPDPAELRLQNHV